MSFFSDRGSSTSDADDESLFLKGIRQITDRHAVEASDGARNWIENLEDPGISFVQVADSPPI